jgi:diguanylate cyclase (GGDEF)-like protein
LTKASDIETPQVVQPTAIDVAQLVQQRHVEIAHANARRGLVPLLVVSVCYALFFSRFVPPRLAFTWLAAVIVLLGVRGMLVAASSRRAIPARAWWIYANTAVLTAIGVAYGITPIWLYEHGDIWLLAVANLWIGGLAVTMLVDQGLVRPIGIAFGLPALAPLLAALLSSGEPVETFLGIGNVLFFCYVYIAIAHAQAHTIDEARQRLMNSLLIERLEAQRRETDRLVEDLTGEIERRKQTEVELLRARRVAESLSRMDHQTGLVNRRVFDEALKREWERARSLHKPLSLVLCDIDRFRAYNDRYGHHAGDQCLTRISNVAASHATGERAFIARYGGEEFAILLPETGEFEALEVAEAIRSDVQELTIMHGASEVEHVVTVSCGVATILPEESGREADLVETAANALQRAKRTGRNCVYTIYGVFAEESVPGRDL